MDFVSINSVNPYISNGDTKMLKNSDMKNGSGLAAT